LVSLAIIFTLLKISVMKEERQNSTVIFTGSIPSSAIVKSPTNESVAPFLTSPSPIQARSAVMDRPFHCRGRDPSTLTAALRWYFRTLNIENV
jgi:hypothetical protein